MKGRVGAALGALEGHLEAREVVFHDQTKLRLFSDPRRRARAQVLLKALLAFCLSKNGRSFGCARFSITPADICPHQHEPSPVGTRCGWCRGIHNGFHSIRVEDASEVLRSPCDYLAEGTARAAAFLPGTEG